RAWCGSGLSLSQRAPGPFTRLARVMPKKTPAQRFHDLFKQWTSGANEHVRAEAEKKMDGWLAKHGKTRADISSIVAEAVDAALKANPPPPPPDARVDESVRYDPKRHSVASLVENLLRAYVTMSEPVLVIYSLAICLTHVYTRFAIAPRIVLAS